jgi:hypothetical protein
MPPTFWVEIEMAGGMGCYRGMTGGEIKKLWTLLYILGGLLHRIGKGWKGDKEKPHTPFVSMSNEHMSYV